MGRIEKTIVINAPVEKVFAFVNDFDNFIKTQPPEVEMESLSQDEGPCRVGFKRMVRSKIGGQVLESEVEYTEFVENKKTTLQQKGGSMKKLVMSDLFEPIDGGTKFTSMIEYELPYSLLGKLLDKLKIQKEIEKSHDYSTKKTKELLEKE